MTNKFCESCENISLYKTIKKYVETHNIKRIGTSLSGGVDSMVMTHVLSQLRIRKVIDIVVAVHLDYGNRKESTMEANYIINWCKYLGIDCVTRKIEHMKRSECSSKKRP